MKYTVIVTTANEPVNLNLLLDNLEKDLFNEIIVVAPDKASEKITTLYNVSYVKDKGQGKIAALNLGLQKARGDVVIFTDGDCVVSNLKPLLDVFQDEKVGLATGRVVPKFVFSVNFPDIIIYRKWDFFHKYLLSAADYIRRKKDFVEATGYLFAFRKKLVDKFPYNVAEDSWASSQIYQKGYKTVYVPESTVAVKGPGNLNDWVKQKVRCARSHEEQQGPRVKSFWNETTVGLRYIFKYKFNNIYELWWLPQLYLLRLYVWVKVKLSKQKYQDGWEPVKSTKTL